MQVRTELSPVTTTSQVRAGSSHNPLCLPGASPHTSTLLAVELLDAEKTLAQGEGVGRVKYLSHRGIQFKPSTFKDMLSSEVGKYGSEQGEGKKQRGQFRSLVDSDSLWWCLSVLGVLQ